MKIGIPAEMTAGETRIAMIPPRAEQFVERGHEVIVSADGGKSAGWTDEDYRTAGCEVIDTREQVFERSDVLLQVRGLGASDEDGPDQYREGHLVIGLLGPYDLDEELEELAERSITTFALELIPRISRAQQMDALSSMASLGGYKAAILAATQLPKLFPMQMTAAGTIRPAEVFVVGAGVAGLQAIATAERLGASVRAYDIRPEVKEEVESLGATFVELDLAADDASDDEGHAREQDEEFYRKQREMMNRVVGESDVVITTAAIPGRPSPTLVTEEMIEGMAPGSVIVDLAAERGGNCEPTEADEVVEFAGVTVHGPTNLPATVSHHASQLYSTNVANFLDLLLSDEDLVIDTSDEIVDATMLTHDGTVRAPHRSEEADGDE